MGDLGDRGDVHHLQRRVGGAFEKKRFGFRPHGGAPRGQIAAVHEGGGDAEARQELLDDVAAGAEERARRYNVIAGD